jgi:L-amino acid N-acyltransferase YncA
MFSIRHAGGAEAAAIQRIYAAEVRDGYATFEEEPPDEAEILRRMLTRPRLPWLVAVLDSRVVGFAYAAAHHARSAYRWSANVSVYLAAEARGKRVGRALYEPLLAEVRRLGYVNAYAGVALPNDASVALHESFGFVRIATYRDVGFKHGRWHDVGWWQLALTPPPDRPVEPREWVPASRRRAHGGEGAADRVGAGWSVPTAARSDHA